MWVNFRETSENGVHKSDDAGSILVVRGQEEKRRKEKEEIGEGNGELFSRPESALGSPRGVRRWEGAPGQDKGGKKKKIIICKGGG